MRGVPAYLKAPPFQAEMAYGIDGIFSCRDYMWRMLSRGPRLDRRAVEKIQIPLFRR